MRSELQITRAQQQFHAAKKEALAFALQRFRSNAREQWKAQKLAEKKAGK